MSQFNDCEAERLIHELKIRRHMWHPRHKLYKNKEYRAQSWDVIARNVIDGYAHFIDSSKKKAVERLKYLWKNLRNNKVKALKFNRRAKPGKVMKRSLTTNPYSEQLEFLESIYSERESDETRTILSEADIKTTPKEENETVSEKFEEDPLDDNAHTRKNTPKSYKLKKHNEIERNYKFNDYQESVLTVSKEDEDQLFLGSLLPTLRQFNTDQKLIFRCRVLEAMIYVKNSQSSQHRNVT